MRTESRRGPTERLKSTDANQATYVLRDGRHVSRYFTGQTFRLPLSRFSDLDQELYLPRLIIGSHLDIREGRRLTFVDKCYEHPYRAPERYRTGLDDYVRIEARSGPTSYYFDNHSACVFAYAEAILDHMLEPGFTVLQIDAHDDARPCCLNYLGGIREEVKLPKDPNKFTSADFEKIIKYLQCLNIAGHNDYSLLSGMVSEVIAIGFHPKREFYLLSVLDKSVNQLIDHEVEILTLSDAPDLSKSRELAKQYTVGSIRQILNRGIPRQRLALVVDLDAFLLDEQINDYNPDEITNGIIDKIAHFIIAISKHAGLLVVNTSPGYSHHKLAVRTARRIAFLLR